MLTLSTETPQTYFTGDQAERILRTVHRGRDGGMDVQSRKRQQL